MIFGEISRRGSRRSGSPGISLLLFSVFMRCSDSSQCAIIWQHQCATRLPTSWYCPTDLDHLDKPGKDSRCSTPACAPIIVARARHRHCMAALRSGPPPEIVPECRTPIVPSYMQTCPRQDVSSACV
ncbi:hypothetical protein PYCCODRAFT_118812 [Trametes coccinea BRFM310]|uniref:Secreted protein n=1 Tax=Trametes coccinea (strain BRFM310) TaxID=1353009 RepID=A0A1Y2IU18_TRAC3|nr:hypothetical protein PYCCODRAFT_118812 [Trametes coccinea BRFM310]